MSAAVDYFRATGAELAALAGQGDSAAGAEIARRAAKRAAKRGQAVQPAGPVPAPVKVKAPRKMSPRMADLHAGYVLAREAQTLRAEAACGANATELASYFGTDGQMDAVEQRVTWKQWLRDTASGAAGEAAQRAYSDGVALGVRMAAGEDVSNAEYDAAELAAGGDAEMFADGVAAGLGRAAESVAV